MIPFSRTVDPFRRSTASTTDACSPPALASTRRPLDAYRQGIFPVKRRDPILWFRRIRAPCVPSRVHVSHSLRKSCARRRHDQVDCAFTARARRMCSAPRPTTPAHGSPGCAAYAAARAVSRIDRSVDGRRSPARSTASRWPSFRRISSRGAPTSRDRDGALAPQARSRCVRCFDASSNRHIWSPGRTHPRRGFLLRSRNGQETPAWG